MDLDDLLGEPRPKLRPGPKPDTAAPMTTSAEMAVKGVTTSWLQQVFRLDRLTVIKRLKTVQPVAFLTNGSPLYEVRIAAEHLLVPKADEAMILRSMRSQDLPNHINVAFQQASKLREDALRAKRRNEEEAGQLWRTERVLEVLVQTFKTIRDEMQLWVERLSENTDVTEDQRRRFMELVDDLQNQLHEKLVELPKKGRTESVRAEAEEIEE
jgi:hypothetical protein